MIPLPILHDPREDDPGALALTPLLFTGQLPPSDSPSPEPMILKLPFHDRFEREIVTRVFGPAIEEILRQIHTNLTPKDLHEHFERLNAVRLPRSTFNRWLGIYAMEKLRTPITMTMGFAAEHPHQDVPPLRMAEGDENQVPLGGAPRVRPPRRAQNPTLDALEAAHGEVKFDNQTPADDRDDGAMIHGAGMGTVAL